MICPDCKGSKVYRGLLAEEPCRACGGTGEATLSQRLDERKAEHLVRVQSSGGGTSFVAGAPFWAGVSAVGMVRARMIQSVLPELKSFCVWLRCDAAILPMWQLPAIVGSTDRDQVWQLRRWSFQQPNRLQLSYEFFPGSAPGISVNPIFSPPAGMWAVDQDFQQHWPAAVPAESRLQIWLMFQPDSQAALAAFAADPLRVAGQL